MNKFQYPALLKPNNEGGFIVSFRDVPEVITEIWSQEELLSTAQDALLTGIEIYFEKRKQFPMPSALKKGEVAIPLSLTVNAKILLLNTMVEGNIRPSDLAKKMGITPQEVNRVIDLFHKTKKDTIQSAINALGKDFLLTII